MVFNTNITSITTNTTLSTIDDVYLINAAGGSITVTLPNITGNGIQYKMKRTDNTATSTVTLTGTGGQTIDGVTSITILPLSICEVQSFNSAWFLISNFSIQRSNAKILFSSAFVSNNSSPFILLPRNSGNPYTFAAIPYIGSNIESISRVTVVMRNTGNAPNASPAATLRITTTNTANVIATIGIDGTSLPPTTTAGVQSLLTTSTITTSNLPTSPGVLYIVTQYDGASVQLEIYSIVIQ